MFSQLKRIPISFVFALSAFSLLFSTIINAHVGLLEPNGGEVLAPGQVVPVKWEVIISHDTQNWDLTYSVTGESGPWLEIATDVALGEPGGGSIHTYLWTVPDNLSDQVRVRIVQDNNFVFDYEDQSNADLAIVCCNGARGNANGDPDDKTNISDVTYLISYLFGIPAGSAPDCPHEGNINGDPGEKINISDVTYLTSFLFGVPAGPTPPNCP
jgi:hypothetical protein